MRRVIEPYGKVIPEFQTPVGFRLAGWVYVLSNPAMPDLYKIGMTTSEPEIRAKEISQGTGVPLPFQVERAYYSENPRDDEKAMHEYLSCCRVNESREFFDASLMEIDMAAEDCGLHRRDEPISVLADGFNVICMNIGATVAVIASKDNNKKKVLLFILSFLTGVLISESVERIIVAETGYEIGKTLTAILVSALFISLLLIIASSETLTKAIRWLPRLIENNFSVLMSTLTEKWRGKK